MSKCYTGASSLTLVVLISFATVFSGFISLEVNAETPQETKTSLWCKANGRTGGSDKGLVIPPWCPRETTRVEVQEVDFFTTDANGYYVRRSEIPDPEKIQGCSYRRSTCYIEKIPYESEDSSIYKFDEYGRPTSEEYRGPTDKKYSFRGSTHIGVWREYLYTTKEQKAACEKKWGRQYCDDFSTVETKYDNNKVVEKITRSEKGWVMSKAKWTRKKLLEDGYYPVYDREKDLLDERFFDEKGREILHVVSEEGPNFSTVIREIDLPGSDIHFQCKEGTYLIEGWRYSGMGDSAERISRLIRVFQTDLVPTHIKRRALNRAVLSVIGEATGVEEKRVPAKALVCGRFGDAIDSFFLGLAGKIPSTGNTVMAFDEIGNVVALPPGSMDGGSQVSESMFKINVETRDKTPALKQESPRKPVGTSIPEVERPVIVMPAM